jgi:predicted amidohydrolase
MIFKIAGVQMDVMQADVERNLAKIEAYARQAAAAQAKLVVFPECALNGYCYDSQQEAEQAAIEVDHPALLSLQELSQQLQIAICCGVLLRDSDGQVRNAVATFVDGQWVDTYFKIHLPFLGVDRFVCPGQQIHRLIEIAGVKIGIHICYEGGFPEVARCLALNGADLILLPTNWPPGSGVSWKVIPACRSIENRVYFMAVNRVGVERQTPFTGNSSVCDVAGNVIDSLEGTAEGIIYAEIDPQQARDKKIVHQAGVYEVDRIGDRRPDLYGRVTQVPS